MQKVISLPTPLDKALTVYYDGGCPVCSREVAVYRRQDVSANCHWVDVSACSDSALGLDLSREAALGRFHVRRADGSLASGISGFAVLWSALPRLAWAGRLASFWPVRSVLDGGYRVFLYLRPLWRKAPVDFDRPALFNLIHRAFRRPTTPWSQGVRRPSSRVRTFRAFSRSATSELIPPSES